MRTRERWEKWPIRAPTSTPTRPEDKLRSEFGRGQSLLLTLPLPALPSLQALDELAVDDRGRDDARGPDGGEGLREAERFA